ncbi:unnamed protein product, partial [Adineta ricciae]
MGIHLVTRWVSTKFDQIPQLLRIQPWVSISLPVGYRPNSIKFLSFYGYSHGYPSRYPLGIDQIRSNSSASTDTTMGIHLVTRWVSTKF